MTAESSNIAEVNGLKYFVKAFSLHTGSKDFVN